MSEKEEIAIYLGTKGYTIYKKNLKIEEQELLRKELTVSPYIPKNSLQQPTYFQIYRESTNKIYNLGNNTSISLNDFIDTCERVCQKKAIINEIQCQKGDVPKTFANINLAKKDFVYKPQTNLFNGLTQLKIWLNNNKHLVK